MKSFLKSQLRVMALFLFTVLIGAFLCLIYQSPIEQAALFLFLMIPVFLVYLYVEYTGWKKSRQNLQADLLDPELYPLEDQIYIYRLQQLNMENSRLLTKRIEEINNLTDSFSVWAHQIKLPVSVLQVLCCDEPKVQFEIDRINQYVEMALAVIRLESSDDFSFQKHQTDDLIRQAIRNQSFMFIHKSIRLNYQPSENQVITDSKWFVFVLEQILSNSLKYTKSGGLVEIWTADQILFIQDNGCGIKPEDLPRVFDKGYTGINGHTQRESTGIGLFICRSILSRMNLSISIESKPDQGTLVKIDMRQNTLLIKD